MSWTTYALGLGLTLGLACSTSPGDFDDSAFREDVIDCEEAVVHVSDCCSIKIPSDACEFHHLVPQQCSCSSQHGTADSDDERPVLSVAESQEILEQSCSDMDCAALETTLNASHRSAHYGGSDCY